MYAFEHNSENFMVIPIYTRHIHAIKIKRDFWYINVIHVHIFIMSCYCFSSYGFTLSDESCQYVHTHPQHYNPRPPPNLAFSLLAFPRLAGSMQQTAHCFHQQHLCKSNKTCLWDASIHCHHHHQRTKFTCI